MAKQSAATPADLGKTFAQVPFQQVMFTDAFWAPRLAAHKTNTIPACLGFSESRIDNFAKAAGLKEGGHEGIFFDDSDLYKILEGAAYSLALQPDPELDRRVDDIIALIAAAQEESGYINTYYQLEKPNEKYTDMGKHELYCGGHLIEAAVAHKQATGKTNFLDVAIKLADHWDRYFGPNPDQHLWVEGHQEPEMALIRLYRETGDERYFEHAKWMLEERGSRHGEGQGWHHEDQEYCQGNVPLLEQTELVGHAVRTAYMFSAMADVAYKTNDERYKTTLDRMWDRLINRNMFVTGGIGSTHDNEGFTHDFDLNNEKAYCETCASIGMVFFNHRMNLLHGDAKYADVMERSLYNAALAGVNLAGDKYFYINPLNADGLHHRFEWIGCACCPSNVARFIPSIGSYVYATGDREAVVNLYAQSEGRLALGNGEHVKLTQTTEHPWEDRVSLKVEPESGESEFTLKLRYPGWCRDLRLQVNGKEVDQLNLEKGYIRLNRVWKAGDTVQLTFAMPVEHVHADPRVEANIGKVALQRGPLVYCFEETDQPIDIEKLTIAPDTTFTLSRNERILNAVQLNEATVDGSPGVVAVPYFAWDNREPGKMKTWVPERNGS
ncbi:glycoside hydrolase family 127 protein [Paenibacillus sacheonensis]|uniref:Glycoside hydrolase family 127 protein n=1 Tax=Paenibacillus sacheonensis TaxID=742054 RepID=A0A7X4YUX5_9BACL|nr:beta-L-arabinofuranosidase domain-containing protein [Paenibacillus sacheonensis]MBM7568366.1 DUF1680 family protein [Paenibacillus sacheonensis]NBC72066.1 glycoside hydrolase family 127 protein [Paenibacillus sacheonensis]